MKSGILALLVVGVVLFGLGAGTWAYFDDTESSTGNYITADILNLKVSHDNSTWYDGTDVPSSIDFGMVYPGWSGSDNVYVMNEGGLPGEVYLYLNYSLDENINPESETNGGQTLADVIYVKIYYNDALVWEGYLKDWTYDDPGNMLDLGPLNGGKTGKITVEASIDYNDAGNDIQGDKLIFDVHLYLKQVQE
ncbi:SipW-dependent-type signal peptide-containing protein [Thermococcus sp.]|uniref:SipW-dependent-type signal peptide-containing protein n=1 Tax=Thermococcus sp. TaxID=35749 RepID=UPI00261270DA|nr:SipW-dependent-type signal peptide-containing protein [Thermococcus sp.]